MRSWPLIGSLGAKRKLVRVPFPLSFLRLRAPQGDLLHSDWGDAAFRGAGQSGSRSLRGGNRSQGEVRRCASQTPAALFHPPVTGNSPSDIGRHALSCFLCNLLQLGLKRDTKPKKKLVFYYTSMWPQYKLNNVSHWLAEGDFYFPNSPRS